VSAGEARARLLREESGFTLSEMMVTIMIMMVVLFALYSIFDMSIRVFSFGSDKVEAVENARLGLERMEREIRAAYPYNNTATPPPDDDLFKTWTAIQITFGNELNGDLKIECPNPAGNCETITYQLSATGDTRTLQRINSATNTAEPVVEFVQPGGLTFRYFTGTTCGGTVMVGAEINPTTPGSCTEADITRVRIQLRIQVPGDPPGTQTLTTDVDLRNRA